MRDKFWNWLLGVFDNNPGGGSMRKIQAVIILLFVAAIHTVYMVMLSKGKFDLTFGWNLVLADYTMIGLLLGLIFAEQVIRFLKGGPPEEPKKEEEKKPE